MRRLKLLHVSPTWNGPPPPREATEDDILAWMLVNVSGCEPLIIEVDRGDWPHFWVYEHPDDADGDFEGFHVFAVYADGPEVEL